MTSDGGTGDQVDTADNDGHGLQPGLGHGGERSQSSVGWSHPDQEGLHCLQPQQSGE